MPDCDYCGESFDGEDPYLDHLGDQHMDELGPIDRRKVEEAGGGTGDLLASVPKGPLTLVFVIGVMLALIGYVTFVMGSGGGNSNNGGGQQPYNLRAVHTHGSITMQVMGETVDFSQDRYQTQAQAFHFENNNGDRWHGHAQGITLQWAMQTLDINVTESTVTYQGTTYRNSDPNVNVSVTVNGNPVQPSEYFLQEGDSIRIIVQDT